MQKVVIVGQGYVGLPVSMAAVEAGFDVVGYETSAAKVSQLASGESYVEDIPDQRLATALASGRYTPTTDIGLADGFDYAVISVPTPLREGVPDLSHIEAAARALSPHLRPGATVILESTTYPGTTEELVGPLLTAGSGIPVGQFHLGYSPERIDPGNASWTLENTPKVVSGVDAASLAKVSAFFDRFVETTVPVRSPKEAELTKLLENTFRHVNIALVNELAVFAHDLGIDIWDAIDAASTKPFGYLRFTPGPGVGGHCLPIDPSYLSWRVRQTLGQPFRFVELANDVNDHMPDYVIRRLQAGLNARGRPVKGQRVLLLGLAYKKNTGDARETPARRIASQLLALGAEVRAIDPHVAAYDFPEGVKPVSLDVAELASADVVVLLVDHDKFDLDLLRTTRTYVLDTRRVLGACSHIEHL